MTLQMTENRGSPGPNELRDHLANSRTLLAWVRTALTIMGFGFVVAKFGLLLPGTFIHGHAHLFSTVAGTILMLVGSVCLIAGTVSFISVTHDIQAGRVRFNPAIHIMLAVFVVLVGILLAIYILLTG
jgi:putative membrane protein